MSTRMIALDEARAIVRAALADRVVGTERVEVDAARGRVLAQALAAPFDVPGFVHSAMDGYAVRAADLRDDAVRLRCVGALLAGRAEPSAAIGAQECVRITTGAPLPQGADTVVIRENAAVQGDFVVLAPGPERGANVRGASDDYGAGELAVAHAFGLETLVVRNAPRVAIVVTGDELLRPGAERGHGQRYETNGALLRALASEAGARTVSVEQVGDERAAIAAALARAARGADLVLTSGGVSAGEADFLPGLVEELGAIEFWKVRMRPGMPVLFGRVYGTPIFALPGNPVSVFATFLALVEPALETLLASPPRRSIVTARLMHAIDKRHDRLELRRATLRGGEDGVLHAELHASTSSGALRSVVESDGLAELAAEARRFEAGEVVRVHRFR
ncbi:MAG TPA: molybdopterin molybdotransferase MoeA [Xanthomonadales bacterium]|nr:molybdopterin molybdotransferase MoeA [Xanthomonadales bacterium]